MRTRELITEAALEQKLRRHLERRELPDAFLYTGPHGAARWLALESSGEFPVASALTALLQKRAGLIAQRASHCRDVVSIGAGDARKERLLLAQLRRLSRPACHIIDISRPLVEEALRNLATLDIRARGVVAFCENLDVLAPAWERPVLLCLLGNNFCNYHPADLLPLLAGNLGAADLFLFDGSLLPEQGDEDGPWRHAVEEVYHCPENVRFNLAPLVARGADPASCRFELKLVTVDTPWGPTYRTQKRIHVVQPVLVQCGTETVALRAGDTIEMGFTYKYRFPQLVECLERYGFRIVESWPDSTGSNALVLTQNKVPEAGS